MPTPALGPTLPPGPRSALRATARYIRDPFTTLLEVSDRYGDPFTWPTFLGPVVVTGNPAGVRDILTADPDTYTALGAELLGPVMGANNLILLSGEAHRDMRRFYGPCFQGQRMHEHSSVMARIAAAHVAGWSRERPVVVDEAMRAISLDVILEVVLGLGERGPREIFKAAILALVQALKPSFMFIPSLRRPMLGLSAWARFRRRAAAATALFEREVAARRAAQSARPDLLTALVATRRADGSLFSGEEILEQMVSLIGAGHETTASALTWALFHLDRAPAVREQLVDELSGAGKDLDHAAVARLPLLDAVCSEVLRLSPVAPLVGRTLRSSLIVEGHRLPAGASVGINIVGLHRRPDLYPDPDRFWPQRFLTREYSPFEYAPFGGGSRRCLGASFAVHEMKLVLATVLRDGDWRLTDARNVRATLRNTTAAPSRKLRMVRAP